MAQDNFSNTSNQESNPFNKGMVKDVSDVYMSEGMWINAINAINNSHEGESGNIGNEMSNKFCTQAPYTIMGMAHKHHKKWILFSGNNIDSEIGEFDEATCEYTTVINDPCLSFKHTHLITAVCKENYDCTWSVYFQDNLNPDRTMNLDNIPYICVEKTIGVEIDYYNYTLSLPDTINCIALSPQKGINVSSTYNVELGSDWGEVVFLFESDLISKPMRFVVEWNGNVVIDTKYVGKATLANNTLVANAGFPSIYELNGNVHPNYNNGGGAALGYPGYNPASMGEGTGSASFVKNATIGTATVTVYPWTDVAPSSSVTDTSWEIRMNCPIDKPGVVKPVIPLIPISYINGSDNVVLTTITDGDTLSLTCIEEASIKVTYEEYEDIVIITKGDFCKTETVTKLDPDACGVKICTDDLDCSALRLHPLVSQPCVQIKRAKGSGQVQNGSYMAVVAYSENGIKLTDYTSPSYPVSIWDHTGIGGGLEVLLSDLDKNYNEYELVVIGVVNQNTVVKRIGFYSTDQTKVTIDLIPDSLVTIPIAYIPLKNTIYEKSEKMSTVNNYLIRSGITTQPFINYQPLANKIKVNWVAVQYPYTYYRDGGTNVGHMRDEVYPYFIRWVYQTGNTTNSYHIPGRAAIPSDLVNVTGDDVIDGANDTWQVYDTSTITLVAPPQLIDPEFNGYIIAKGRMGFWASTERYPNEQPDVWNTNDPTHPEWDLCNQNIRHHKMPSNNTIHIHNNQGQNIVVLGVEFTNIEPPVDENGNVIPDIVGYEILRGSREGNRSIVAKGMFNNMREFPYDADGITTTAPKYGLYQNYPYNDLRKDTFLTRDPNLVSDGDAESPSDSADNDEYGLTVYYKNKFSFHSPETTFLKPYLGSGTQIRLYTQEQGQSIGNFRIPYKHPEHILITDAAFVTGVVVGFGIALVNAIGQTTSSATLTGGFNLFFASLDLGVTGSRGPSGTTLGNVADIIVNGATNLTGIPGLIGGLIGFVTKFSYFMGGGIDQVLRTIRALSREQQYALQFNSHCFYNTFSDTPTLKVISRKSIDNGVQYIGRGVQRVDNNRIINNLNRNKYVYCHVTIDVPDPIGVTDNTRQRIIDIASTLSNSEKKKLYDNPTKKSVVTNSVAYYGALKFDFENQYGQLSSIQQIPISQCILSKATPTTNVMFGGDVYINRYTEKNPYYFFNTWMYDLNDNTGFDYRLYINGPLPRYWANYHPFNSEDFDITLSDLNNDPALTESTQSNTNGADPADLDASEANNVFDRLRTLKDRFKNFDFDNTMVTPSDFHRLDRRQKISGVFRIKDAYFYLFYNGIRDFFCESELNMAFRDWGESDTEKFYDVYNHSFDDIDYMFRSDKITTPIFNKYDLSLSASKLFNQFYSWANILPRDYDPQLYSTCFEYFPRRSVYSLKQVEGLKRDNWRNFLALNYRDFQGRVSTIKTLNKVGAIILFEDAEPTLFSGTDSIQTAAGTKYTIGDSALFDDRNMQAIVNADDTLGFGTCISSRSAVNTPHGLFFISQDSGKIFQYASELVEISKNGMKHWFAENLPSYRRETDPTWIHYDNPIIGDACQAIYDPTYELVYFTKRSFKPLRDDLLYDEFGPYYLDPDYSPEPLPGNCNIPLDVAFVLDVTGSMSGVLNNIKSTIPGIITAIQLKSNNDYRLAYITVNEGCGGENSLSGSNVLRVSFAPNNDVDFDVKLQATIIGGGCAVPEPTDTAIRDLVFNTAPLVSIASSTTAGTWRPNAYKMIIVITDAVPSNSTDNYNPTTDFANITQLATDARDNDIKIFSIATGTGVNIQQVKDVLQEYSNVTGGSYSEAPLGLVESSILTFIEDVTCPPIPIPKIRCNYSSSNCFEPAHWTVSYDPKNKMWVSFHDWIPTLVMPSNQHFNTINFNTIWKHNDDYNSYCNYYGVNYPWEVEYPIVNLPSVTTIRNLEYVLEVYEYTLNGRDRLHILDYNFDRAVLYNSEQISGLLKLNIKGKNTPSANLTSYPSLTTGDLLGTQANNILYSKEENKYRFNQFWDITNNRGEFIPDSDYMFNTLPNGFKKNINELYVNYAKSPLQRKKFRHYGNRLILRRMASGNKKMILKLVTTKTLLSRL